MHACMTEGLRKQRRPHTNAYLDRVNADLDVDLGEASCSVESTGGSRVLTSARLGALQGSAAAGPAAAEQHCPHAARHLSQSCIQSMN